MLQAIMSTVCVVCHQSIETVACLVNVHAGVTLSVITLLCEILVLNTIALVVSRTLVVHEPHLQIRLMEFVISRSDNHARTSPPPPPPPPRPPRLPPLPPPPLIVLYIRLSASELSACSVASAVESIPLGEWHWIACAACSMSAMPVSQTTIPDPRVSRP